MDAGEPEGPVSVLFTPKAFDFEELFRLAAAVDDRNYDEGCDAAEHASVKRALYEGSEPESDTEERFEEPPLEGQALLAAGCIEIEWDGV